MSMTFDEFRLPSSEGGKRRRMGNVILQVEEYLRDEPNGRVIAVQGTDLRDGQELIVRLAGVDQWTRLYTNPNEDQAVRRQVAEKKLTNRKSLDDIANPRERSHVPVGGVLALTDVRPDYNTGHLYGRWPEPVVTQPTIEDVLVGQVEIKKTLTKTQQETLYARVYFPQHGKGVEQLNKDILDAMLKGTFRDTGAGLRTGIAVAIELGNEIRTYGLNSPMVNENGKTRLIPGVEAALSGEHKPHSALAAAVVAAVSGVAFDQLRFSQNVSNEQRQAFGRLYEAVREGEVRAVVFPGASMNFATKTRDNLLKAGQERSGQEVFDRGFIAGAIGIRHTSAREGEIFDTVVAKAVTWSDNLPPRSGRNAGVTVDLNGVGRIAFAERYADADAPALRQPQSEGGFVDMDEPEGAPPLDDMDDGFDETLETSDYSNRYVAGNTGP